MPQENKSQKPELPKIANIMGLGLIGGSVGLSLCEAGWEVAGTDSSLDRTAEALELGAISSEQLNPEAEITFLAAPVNVIPELAKEMLQNTKGFVTDVGSVKSHIAEKIKDPRFVGGHPMAGNEQLGLAGASADLFKGALWVLTPTPETSEETYTRVREVVSHMGAEVAVLPPDQHDLLVAVVSHVPHLTAGSLMRMALEQSETQSVLMRLAAGGFRDMTRVAAGEPSIWVDICQQNSEAISQSLELLIQELTKVKEAISSGDTEHLSVQLEKAREGRISLPTGAPDTEKLSELRVPMSDKPGEVATIAGLASQTDVNIYDLEIAHSAEGEKGVMILVVDSLAAEHLVKVLAKEGYQPSIHKL